MKLLAYAILALALVVVPGVAAEEPSEEAPPCDWFFYSLDPPGYHLDIDCLISQLPPIGNP